MFDYEYVGNLHVHTSRSDGALGVKEIARSAARAGLDFVCLNDHDYLLDDLHVEDEGFHGKVLVLVGLEIGQRFNHYLAFDLKKMIHSGDLAPQEVIDEVRAQKGLGFLAHPFEKGMPFVQKSKAYTWNDFSVKGFTGVCIWNFSSRWKERIKTPIHGLVCLVLKRQVLEGPSRETLSFWDELCQSRTVPAIGGSDAHGTLFRWGLLNFRPLSYDYLLGTINVHVLLKRKIFKDYAAAKGDIHDAIRSGRLFIAHDKLFPARGFRFDFMYDDGSDLVMGEQGPFQKGEIVIELPGEGEIRLMRDGKSVKVWRGREAVYRVREKGVYRVEVYRRLLGFGWRPWIFSNPVYLR